MIIKVVIFKCHLIQSFFNLILKIQVHLSSCLARMYLMTVVMNSYLEEQQQKHLTNFEWVEQEHGGIWQALVFTKMEAA